MRFALVTLLSMALAVTGAPTDAEQDLEKRYVCRPEYNDCPRQCAAGSVYINCSGSVVCRLVVCLTRADDANCFSAPTTSVTATATISDPLRAIICS